MEESLTESIDPSATYRVLLGDNCLTLRVKLERIGVKKGELTHGPTNVPKFAPEPTVKIA